MSGDTVSYLGTSIGGRICTLSLNRPEVMNAINEEMLPLWVDALEQCRVSEDVDVIIVTGAGDCFCRGGDVSKLGAHTEPNPLEKRREAFGSMHRVSNLMFTIP